MADANSSTCLIDVSTRDRPNTFAMIDLEDYELVSKWKWRADRTGTAIRYEKGKAITMARAILNQEKSRFIWHENGCKLDFRKSNLSTTKPPALRCGAVPIAPEGFRYIDVSTKKYPCRYAMVDEGDYEWLSKWRWFFTKGGYVVRAAKKSDIGCALTRKHVRMHREIVGEDIAFGLDVDHVDGNPLNNTRRNLRVATKAENGRNRKGHGPSGFKGVYLRSDTGKFAAQIKVNRKAVSLGSYTTPERAHQAYCKAADRLHGDFANTEHRDLA